MAAREARHRWAGEHQFGSVTNWLLVSSLQSMFTGAPLAMTDLPVVVILVI